MHALLGIGAKTSHAASAPMQRPVQPAPTPAPAAGLLDGLSAAAAAGELNIFLTKRQLQMTLLEMLQDDAFLQVLHEKYMRTAMRVAEEREMKSL